MADWSTGPITISCFEEQLPTGRRIAECSEAKTIISKISVHDESDRDKILNQGSCAAVPSSRDDTLSLGGKGKLGFYQIGSRRIVGESHIEQYLSLAERKADVKTIH